METEILMKIENLPIKIDQLWKRLPILAFSHVLSSIIKIIWSSASIRFKFSQTIVQKKNSKALRRINDLESRKVTCLWNLFFMTLSFGPS